MYRQAVEWLEDAGKDALAGDVFRWELGLAWLGGLREGGMLRRMGIGWKTCMLALLWGPPPLCCRCFCPSPDAGCGCGPAAGTASARNVLALQAGHRAVGPHREVERRSGHAAALCCLLRRLRGPQL